MRAKVSAEATRLGQSVLLGQQGHQDTDGCCKPNPASVALAAGETGGSSEGQKVTAMIQQCKQGEDKSLQTTILPEGKGHQSFVSTTFLNQEILKTAKAHVEKAVKMHKIFAIQGPYPVIREGLRARGWVEQHMHRPKKHERQRRHNDNTPCSNDAGDSDDDDNSDNVEKEQDPDELHNIMSHLVRKEKVYFYWTNRRGAIDTNQLQKEQIINHFAEAGNFTTKVGLCVNLRNLHWFDSADPDTFFPRCYKLAADDEKHAFIEDFRRTACTSLLKCIVERKQGVQQDGLSYNIHVVRDRKKLQFKPIVVSQVIDSALRVCQRFLDSLEHKDIDFEMLQPLTEKEWAQFLDSYYLIAHGRAEVENSDHLVKCCSAMLQRLREVSPQLDIDGTQNIWIIKPGAKSRGRGIKCVKRLDQILKLVNGDTTMIKKSKWVVQKYVECPLLVHGTKFDVRQWFLVTDWNPLTVWFYKKCYLRFSTQLYSLESLDSSVHLCNNSIQKHLIPSQQRHRGIPADNMWSDDQFGTFLSSQGREAQWQTVVVPGMKKAIIHSLQTAQELMDSRKNTFELYGADFVIGCDLHPWLIEINSSPTMAPSTPVTARLCAAVQEDTLRVVLDRRVDRNANTGHFQLIYKQAAVEVPKYVGLNLLVEGFKIKTLCPLPPLMSSKRSASKHSGLVKEEKKSAAGKFKHLPKPVLKSAGTQLMNTSSEAKPPPHVPPEPPEHVSSEYTRFLPPLNVNKLIHLPSSAPSGRRDRRDHRSFQRRSSSVPQRNTKILL